MPKFQDLTGQRFGKLTVLERAETKYGKTRWLCQCDCGKTTTTITHRLLSGSTRSCGCYIPNRKRTHGMSNTRIYQIWHGMKKRCENSNERCFSRYGAKGITVCDEWHSFESFYSWSMEHGYSDNLSIDRIDNSRGYSPDNCRWITMKEQSYNKSTNVFLTHDGVTKTITEWANDIGISPKIALQRYRLASKKGVSISFDDIFFNGNRLCRKILQLTKDGALIHEWESMAEASRAGYDKTCIIRCCAKKQQSHRGYLWSYSEEA